MTFTIENAIIIATDAHKGQTDKQGKPYILHPIRVMLAVPAALQSCAVLHDTIEDTNLEFSDLQDNGMHSEELLILDLLTKPKGMSRETYIGRILGHPSAVRIKIADIHDNLDRVYGLEPDSRDRLITKYARDLHQIAQDGYDVKTGLKV